MMPLSVELQQRDGGWVRLGDQQDGGHGVAPASIEFGGDLNEYGCLDASFRLKLNPRFPRNIIEHFTPVVISDGAEHVWSGRIIAAPTTFADDAEIVVQCQGWGQHLKDDCTDREWVVDDLTRFVDSRSIPGAQLGLGFLYGAGQLSVDSQIAMMTPNATALTINGAVGVTLDLGPNNLARRIVVTYTGSNNSSQQAHYVRVTDSPDWFSSGESQTVLNNAGASGTIVLTPTTARRYVQIGLYNNATYTPGADVWFKASSVKVFTSTSDESGNTSILKASTVISNTLDLVAPLISTDRSKIQATTTNIPNFPGSPGYRYGNELIDAANAIHGYVARLSPDPVPVFEYAPQPTDYSYMVGAGEYTLLEPAAQDGRPVYSRVISEYEDAAGVRGESVVTNPLVLHGAQPVNANFDDASSFPWTNNASNVYAEGGASSINRDTAAFDTSPASLRMTGGSTTGGIAVASTLVSASEPVALAPNTRYVFRIAVRRIVALTDARIVLHVNNTGNANDVVVDFTATAAALATGAFNTLDIVVNTDARGARAFSIGFKGALSTDLVYLDTVKIYRTDSTVVDRRGFRRTALRPPGMKTTAATALALAQLELDNSQYPPFRGTIGIIGRIRCKGGTTIPVSMLPARVGDGILVENLADPNSGALGRFGVIQTAKYNEALNRTELTIDSASSFISNLRARLRIGTA